MSRSSFNLHLISGSLRDVLTANIDLRKSIRNIAEDEASCYCTESGGFLLKSFSTFVYLIELVHGTVARNIPRNQHHDFRHLQPTFPSRFP